MFVLSQTRTLLYGVIYLFQANQRQTRVLSHNYKAMHYNDKHLDSKLSPYRAQNKRCVLLSLFMS
jgi:hypothetical protein